MDSTSLDASPALISVARVACALCAALAASCASAPARTDAEATIRRSVGASIEFRWQGTPTNVAAEADDALPFATAVRRAVESSAELQAALARVRAAQTDADLASLLPNPILDLVFRFPEGGGATEVEAGLGIELLALLQRPRRATIATHRFEAEAARALTTALDVVADVEARYVEVQALESSLPWLEQRGAVFDRLREVAEARLAVGEGTRQDVTTLESERVSLAVEVSSRQRALRIARLSLARAIGEPSSSADWSIETWSAPRVVVADESTWIDAALSNRPEILAIAWEIDAREAEEAFAGAASFEGASVGAAAERDGGWSLGPAVSTPLPIFDSGRVRLARARALTAEARHRLAEVERAAIEEVRTAYVTLVGALENLARVEHDLLPLQTRRRSEIEAAYRQGFVDVTALLFADQSLQETQARRVDLARDVTLAESRLRRSVGGPALFPLMSQADRGSGQP